MAKLKDSESSHPAQVSSCRFDLCLNSSPWTPCQELLYKFRFHLTSRESGIVQYLREDSWQRLHSYASPGDIYAFPIYTIYRSCMHSWPKSPSHFALAFSSSTSASSCVSHRSLKTSSENLFALSRERWRMARASAGGSSRALAKPSANCSSVEAWKPVME